MTLAFLRRNRLFFGSNQLEVLLDGVGYGRAMKIRTKALESGAPVRPEAGGLRVRLQFVTEDLFLLDSSVPSFPVTRVKQPAVPKNTQRKQ